MAVELAHWCKHLLVTYALASALLFLHPKGDTDFRFLLFAIDLLQNGALANPMRSMKFVQIRSLELVANRVLRIPPDVPHSTKSGQRRQVATVGWLVAANPVRVYF